MHPVLGLHGEPTPCFMYYYSELPFQLDDKFLKEDVWICFFFFFLLLTQHSLSKFWSLSPCQIPCPELDIEREIKQVCSQMSGNSVILGMDIWRDDLTTQRALWTLDGCFSNEHSVVRTFTDYIHIILLYIFIFPMHYNYGIAGFKNDVWR